MSIRETVLKSLSAVGAQHEAKFYADLFARQDAETFAMVVLDPRCLREPLLEALIAALRILSNLELSPTLVVGAMEDQRTSVKAQAQRLSKELGKSGVRTMKLNTATYGLIKEVRKVARLTIADLPEFMENETFSAGQVRFLDSVLVLEKSAKARRSYVIASPLNLLGELFTTNGSGTLIRRGIDFEKGRSFKDFDKSKLTYALESAFDKRLKPSFFDSPLHAGFVESEYRGGALFKEQAGIPYLSKFFVAREARGDGIAKDIWNTACKDVPSFVWRSRMGNPFNAWYMRKCDGMQRAGDWRIFWIGLEAGKIGDPILAAASAPDDFES